MVHWNAGWRIGTKRVQPIALVTRTAQGLEHLSTNPLHQGHV